MNIQQEITKIKSSIETCKRSKAGFEKELDILKKNRTELLQSLSEYNCDGNTLDEAIIKIEKKLELELNKINKAINILNNNGNNRIRE